MRVLREIFVDPGFFVDIRLSREELDFVRKAVRSQWLSRIADVAPELVDACRVREMDRYHEIASLLDHKEAWPKSARIMPSGFVTQFRQFAFFKRLESYFGDIAISNEERVAEEEMYWRLVRPNHVDDVGPIHADSWFWELGHGITPKNVTRIKLWIPIYCEVGINGFCYVRNSHRQEWKYRSQFRDGMVKPLPDFSPECLNVEVFQGAPGQAIIFNDRLLHGGAVGGSTTRVSLEFTMFIEDSRSAPYGKK